MSITWSWIYLILAGLFEVCWAIGLKFSHGFTKPVPTAITIAGMICSMYFLAKATQKLPIGTAYGVWVGIGAFGAAALGILLLNESVNPLRLFFLGLLLVSIVGLKVTS